MGSGKVRFQAHLDQILSTNIFFVCSGPGLLYVIL